MREKVKWLTGFICMVFMLFIPVVSTKAAMSNVVLSGDWGATDDDNVYYELVINNYSETETTYTLNITGTGNMKELEYDSEESYPWREYRGKITQLKVDDGITGIAKMAFSHCAFTSVELPTSLTYLGNYCFWYCQALPSITIPSGIKKINEYAFDGCGALTSISLPDTLEIIENHAFSSCGTLENITIPAGVTEIGGNLFWNCKKLSSVTIKGNVKEIPQSVFSLCKELSTVSLPDSVQTIGESAFNGCEMLTTINTPKSLKVIKNSAFRDCKLMDGFEILPTVTSIEQFAFYGCESWTCDLTIPEGITEVSSSAFYNCKNISSVTLPASLKQVGNGSFFGLEKITSIILPDSVSSIYPSAFGNCKALKVATIPNTVSEIDSSSFGNCESLEKIYFIGDGTENLIDEGKLDAEEAKYYINAAKHYFSSSCDKSCNKEGCSYAREENELTAHVHLASKVNSMFAKQLKKAANCTEAAVYYKYCDKCNTLSTDTFKYGTAKGHNYDAGKVTRKPTGQKAGVMSYTCKRCGKKKTQAIPRLKKGLAIKDDKTKAKVKILSVKDKTVVYIAPAKLNKEISIPANITAYGVSFKVIKIKDSAFKGNRKLTKITIPKTIQSIGKDAFRGCSKLKMIVVKTTKLKAKNVGSNAFKGTPRRATMKVNVKCLKAYKEFMKLKGFRGKVSR